MPNSVYHRYYRIAGSYLKNPGKMNGVINDVMGRVSTFNRPEEEIRSIKNRILVFVRMLKAYLKKEYTQVPWKTITAIAAGLIYFVTPIDLIPDFIPITGFVDDFTVLIWVFNNFRKDIDDFLIWEQAV